MTSPNRITSSEESAVCVRLQPNLSNFRSASSSWPAVFYQWPEIFCAEAATLGLV
jgi:hypothetical protein